MLFYFCFEFSDKIFFLTLLKKIKIKFLIYKQKKWQTILKTSAIAEMQVKSNKKLKFTSINNGKAQQYLILLFFAGRLINSIRIKTLRCSKSYQSI